MNITNKEKYSSFIIEILLLLISLLFYVFSWLYVQDFLVGLNNVFYNSDTMYLPSLYKDLFIDGAHYSGWKLTPAPFFFPEMLIYFLLQSFIKDFQISLQLTQFACISLCSIVIGFIFSKYKKNNSQILPFVYSFISFGVVFVVIRQIFPSNEFNASVPFMLPGYHIGALLFCFLSFFLSLKALQNNISLIERRMIYLFLFIVSFIAFFSDLIYFVQFAFPFFATLIVLFLLKRIEFNQIKFFVIIISSSLLLSKILARFLIHYRALHDHLSRVDKVQAAKSSFTALLHDSISSPILTIFIFFFIGTCFFVFIKNLLLKKKLSLKIETFLIFAILMIICNIAAVILSGMYAPFSFHSCFRYLLSIVFIPYFACFLFIFQFSEKNIKILYSIISIILGIGLYFPLSNINNLKLINNYQPSLVSCLDKNVAKYQIKNGLAQYWDSKIVTMFSKKDLFVVASTPHPQNNPVNMFHWINNIDWYKKKFDFIIYDPKAPEGWQFDKDKLIKSFGEPNQTFQCGQKQIWIYKGNSKFESYFANNFK